MPPTVARAFSLARRLAKGFTAATSAAVFVSVFAASAATALDLDTMTSDERTAFRSEVRAYLLENPEVLMEAIAVLEQRQAEAETTRDERLAVLNADALFNDGYSYVGGNPEGDITMVEFIDYRCGFCRRAHPEVQDLVESDGNIRIITKELPILGEQSVLASRFAIATKQALGPEAYKSVSDALMELRGDVTPASLASLAEAFGLDSQAIFEILDSAEVTAEIAQTRDLADRLQISGTPTFVIQDQMLRGYLPLSQMQLIVSNLREDS